MRLSKVLLAGLVLAHVVLGLWFNTATPIFEAPDEDTAMRQLIANGIQGNNRTVTMRAFSEDEMTRIVGGLP